MQFFCDRADGGHHNRLITEVISRVERFCDHGELELEAARFCDPIAEIPYLKRFVTTNWDPFLERALDILVPIVEDNDLAFWDDGKRQLLKLHGCVTRPRSMVATQSDYDACIKRNPLIFNKLKDLMATKTFVFVGYSMRDADFRVVWEGITRKLGCFRKLAFAIVRAPAPDAVSYWGARGVKLLRTYDTVFAECLREKLEEEDLIPTRRFLASLRRECRRVASTHIKMGQQSAGKLASAMWQDGLLHALDYVLTSTALGAKTREDFETELSHQNQELNEELRRRDAIEIAYRSSWVEVLKKFCTRSPIPIPHYFHPYRAHPTKKLVIGERFLS
jgi:SIR2-like domain